MVTVKIIGKYNPKTGKLNRKVKEEEKGIALASLTDKVINDEENKNFDYIIYYSGYKLKSVSKDNKTYEKSKVMVDEFKDFYKRQKRNVIIKEIFMDEDAPLEMEAKILAGFVDTISPRDDIQTINLIGHSKAGTMMFSTPKYFKNNQSFKKSNVYTTATPFLGCLVASPKYFYPMIYKTFLSILKVPELAKKVYDATIKFYENGSGTHMENDIAIPGGVLDKYKDKYDKDYILHLLDIDNVIAIKKVNHYENITTGIEKGNLESALKRGDLTDVGLCILDKYFIPGKSDGFVELNKEEAVDDKLEQDSYHINATTHNFLKNKEKFGEFITRVEDNLEYEDDIRKFRKRK